MVLLKLWLSVCMLKKSPEKQRQDGTWTTVDVSRVFFLCACEKMWSRPSAKKKMIQQTETVEMFHGLLCYFSVWCKRNIGWAKNCIRSGPKISLPIWFTENCIGKMIFGPPCITKAEDFFVWLWEESVRLGKQLTKQLKRLHVHVMRVVKIVYWGFRVLLDFFFFKHRH